MVKAEHPRCIAANDQLDNERFNRLIDILFNPEQVAELDKTSNSNEIAKLLELTLFLTGLNVQ